MLSKIFLNNKDAIKFFEQLKDCISTNKELGRKKMFDCIEEANKVNEVIKYTDCVNNNFKSVPKIVECVEKKNSYNLKYEVEDYETIWPTDLTKDLAKIDNDFSKLQGDLDVILNNKDLLEKSTESILKDENVALVLNDISLLHGDILKYIDHVYQAAESLTILLYIGSFAGCAIALAYLILVK